jgi:hypothetical protein
VAVAAGACGASGLPVAARPAGRPATTAPRAALATATVPVARSAPPATAASNRSAARREATRLVARGVLPPGATPATRAPARLDTAPDRPSAATVVDRHRTWKVARSLASTLAYVAAHPPAGLKAQGSGRSYDGRMLVEGDYDYAAASTAAWAQADYEVSVASISAHVSAVRVDGLVVWLDPRPYRDDARGPRLHVTLANGCPVSDRHIVGVTNPGAYLDREMLPSTRPTAGLVCSYDGLDGRPFRLVEHRRLAATQAARAARAVRSVPLAHVDGGVTACPEDTGAATVLVLSYPAGNDVDVWGNVSGCESVANGHILAFGSAAPIDGGR